MFKKSLILKLIFLHFLSQIDIYFLLSQVIKINLNYKVLYIL